jgi:glucan biosynthesis protein
MHVQSVGISQQRFEELMNATRRSVSLGLSALSLLGVAGLKEAIAQAENDQAQTGLRFGEPRPFSFEQLVDQAEAASKQPYASPIIRFDDILDRIDPEVFADIRYRQDQALWADGSGPWPIRFHHPGRWFKRPVHINLVENGQAREILYEPWLFEFGDKAGRRASRTSTGSPRAAWRSTSACPRPRNSRHSASSGSRARRRTATTW